MAPWHSGVGGRRDESDGLPIEEYSDVGGELRARLLTVTRGCADARQAQRAYVSRSQVSHCGKAADLGQRGRLKVATDAIRRRCASRSIA